jgi:flagellar assembly protein FliH
MSCRVYRPGDDLEASPIAWRPAGGAATPALSAQKARAPGTAGASAANGPGSGTGSRAGASSGGSAGGASEAEVQARVEAAYRQGESAGAQAAAERLTAPLASLGKIVQELAGTRPRVRAEAEQGVVNLAIAIARRVLHREISTDPAALLGLVKSAAERVNARELHRLRVAPPDAGVLLDQRDRMGLPPGLEIVSDPGLVSGSVIFETLRGELDASVETQLDEIERGLADRLRRRGAGGAGG